MPIFTYECPDHGAFGILAGTRLKTWKCDKCGATCPNVFKSGTVRVVDRLDNGLMARAVERLSDINEIDQQDSDKFTPETSDDTES
jgi:hypothetical protein